MVVSSQLEHPSHQEKAACCLLPTVDGDWKFLTSIRNEALHRKRARTLGVRGGSRIARTFLILFPTGSIAVAATREGGLSVHMLSAERKIPIYTCRAPELPEGWRRLE